MLKLCFSLLVLILCSKAANAQLEGNETPQKLFHHIQKTPPDTNRIKLQLRLGGYYLFKPGSFKDDLDSAFRFFNQALQLSDSLHAIKWHNETLKLKGDCYLEGENLVPGTKCFMQVINYYHKAADKRKEADTYRRLGDCITKKNSAFIDAKTSCYGHASSIYKLLKDTIDEANALKDEADAHLYQKKPELAEMELKQVLVLYKAIHYKNLHYAYDLLAAANALKGDLHQELFYRLEMVKSMEAAGDIDNAPMYYYSLADIYNTLGIYNQKEIFNKGIAACEKNHNYPMLSFFIALYARVLLNQNKNNEALHYLQSNRNILHSSEPSQSEALDWIYGDLYQAMGKNALAEKYYQKMIQICNQYQPTPAVIDAYAGDYISISYFYVNTKQFTKAAHYVNVLAKLPQTNITMTNLRDIALLKFKVDSVSGNYLASIKDFELNKKITDSLFNATKSRQIAEMEIKYETTQKEKDLQLQQKNIQILTKQSQLQKQQVIQTRTTKNMLIGGSCILLLFSGVLYNRYLFKQRSNVQLTEQKMEISAKNTTLETLLHDNEWLMRELHHRVKNNMQMVMSLLSSQAAYLKDDIAIKTVTESQHRIQAMSLIHQKLYKTNNVSNIYMPEYIYELMDYLKESFKIGKNIGIDLRIQHIFLDVLQAVPMGLILNEVITNAIKYAFPHTGEDKIMVMVALLDSNDVLLAITDNGRGLPNNFDIDGSTTFGMILIKGLTADLGGKCTIVSNNGTSVNIIFPCMTVLQKHTMEN